MDSCLFKIKCIAHFLTGRTIHQIFPNWKNKCFPTIKRILTKQNPSLNVWRMTALIKQSAIKPYICKCSWISDASLGWALSNYYELTSWMEIHNSSAQLTLMLQITIYIYIYIYIYMKLENTNYCVILENVEID